MLLDINFLKAKKVLHLGAHDAEEHDMYDALGWDVLWVEAIPDKADALRERGFNVVEAAVWSEETTLTFYRTTNDQSSSLLPLGTHLEHYPHIQVSESWKMQTRTVDDICFEAGFMPDGIVLDIQGAEREALMGAVRIFPYLQWVYSEVSTESLYVDGVLEEELNEFLEERGFTQVERTMTPHGWGDAIWVR